MLLGNFAKDTTLLGTGLSVAIGLTGLDIYLDVRDLIADFTVNFKPKSLGWWGNVALDAIGVLPIAGAIKNGKGLAKGAKKAENLVDEGADAAKKLAKLDLPDMNLKPIRKLADNIDEGADTAKKLAKSDLSDMNTKQISSLLGDIEEGGDAYERFLKYGAENTLNSAEMKGLTKVDKQLVLNKVDYQAILENRGYGKVEKNLNSVLKDTEEVVKGGSKAISYTDYDNIYQNSIHNVGEDKVMLGKYDGGGSTSYITKAGSDYEYFSLGKDWDAIKTQYGYTDNDMFKLFNESFLDDGINARKTFQFSHNPVGDSGSLGQEFKYLSQNNYLWNETTMTMIPKY